MSELHDNADIVKTSRDIMTLVRTKTALLDYKPSLLAAAAFFIAVWKVHQLNK